MFKAKKNFEVVEKYYFRKKGVLETQGYDWIGKVHFELYPVELDGKLGFTDSNGDIVIPIIYDRELHVNGTVAWTGNREYFDLKKNGLYGLIKHDGSIVVDFCWGGIRLDKLSEDLIPVAIDEKWGFVNVKTGKTQVEPAYDQVEFFKNGFAPIRIEDKWGMIDVNGNMIVKPKYLLDSHFEGDFAIMFEGGSWHYGWNCRKISDSNCKIVNKKGYEIVSDCLWIDRTGINVFTLTMKENGKKVKKVKQLIAFPDYIVVIDDGKYLKGYITARGKYSKKHKYNKKLKKCSVNYTHAKYIGGGTWSVIDYSGKLIKIPDHELKEIKKSLLA